MNDLYIIVDKQNGSPLSGVYTSIKNAKYEYKKMNLPERYEICLYTFVASMGIVVDD